MSFVFHPSNFSQGRNMISKMLLLGIFLIMPQLVLASEKKTIEVSLRGVNYSPSEFRYYIIDPNNPESSGGGELIDPFGAGGITCCAILPRNWHQGAKLKVRTTHWKKNVSDGARVEVTEVHQVEVPRYPNGKPGELWVLREGDGKISLVSSDHQPDHPNWPGKIKGWPVSSFEYRREKWEIFRKHEADGLASTTKFLNDLDKYPVVTALKMWETEREYDPKSVAGFSGPNDPRYLASLKTRYKQGLEENRQRLQKVLEGRP